MKRVFILSITLVCAFALSSIGHCNEPPYFVGCQNYLVVGSGNRLIHDFIAVDPDGDPLIYRLEFTDFWPSDFSFNSSNGRFDMAASNDYGLYQGKVTAGDGQDSVVCTFYLEVVACGDLEFYLDGGVLSQPPKGLPGSTVEVAIVCNFTSENVDGFNFLIEFDSEYLTFIEAKKGPILNTCEWEYFTYADESPGKAGDKAPSGLARVTALADTGSDDHHPTCPFLEVWDEVATTLTFQVSENPSYQGMRIPVSFYWMTCADNLIYCYNPTYGKDDLKSGCVTFPGSDSSYICNKIIDLNGTNLTDHNYGLPSAFGPPDACFVYGLPLPIPLTKLFNGSIEIACPGDGDANGDATVNVGDAVFLISYVFLGGASPDPLDAGDANCDGNVNVGDAVYLINHIFKGGPGPCVECP